MTDGRLQIAPRRISCSRRDDREQHVICFLELRFTFEIPARPRWAVGVNSLPLVSIRRCVYAHVLQRFITFVFYGYREAQHLAFSDALRA